jgi:hypothetical protein
VYEPELYFDETQHTHVKRRVCSLCAVKKRRNKYSSRQKAPQTLKARQQQLFRECTWKKQHALEKLRRARPLNEIYTFAGSEFLR